MLILIFYFTLFGFFFTSLFGYKIGRFGSFFFSFLSHLFSFFIVLWYFRLFLIEPSNIFYFTLGVWIKSGLINICWGFLFDSLSIVMCFVVLLVALVVQIYSYSYMYGDPSLPRFLSYLCLFVFFMLILVTSTNFVMLFVGWEGVGLCSYLLISFWNTRLPALKSALKAMLVNRIGDFFLLVGMIFILNEFGSLNFLTLFPLIPYFSNSIFFLSVFKFNFLNFVCFFLSLAAFGKSAQIGLHTWLPDAMEGPTPVSALIHAATMVTAGIFLVIRCTPLFEYSPVVLNFLAFMGAVTALFAGFCGTTESDIKKVIAYSTCSQLGYMFFVCGLSGYNVGLFHLFNHAFFKALLFLSAGSVIHSLSNEQNISRMGALKNILPFTYSVFLIGLLSLNAFPFTAGFYSKEMILSLAYTNLNSFSFFAYTLGITASFLTSFYSYRLLYFVFLSENNINKQVMLNFSSENFITILPLSVLAFFSIFSGWLFKDLFLGLGSNFFNYSIFILPENLNIHKAEFLPSSIKLLPLIFSILGWGIVNPYFFNSFIKYKTPFLYILFKNEWFFNLIYNVKLNFIYVFGFRFIFLNLDAGFLQTFGPRGFSNSLYRFSNSVIRYHSGFVHSYLCINFLGLILFFVFSDLVSCLFFI